MQSLLARLMLSVTFLKLKTEGHMAYIALFLASLFLEVEKNAVDLVQVNFMES